MQGWDWGLVLALSAGDMLVEVCMGLRRWLCIAESMPRYDIPFLPFVSFVSFLFFISRLC